MKTPEEVNQLLLDEERKRIDEVKTYIEKSINSGYTRINLSRYNTNCTNKAVKELSEQLSNAGWFYMLKNENEYETDGEVGGYIETVYLILSSTPFVKETPTKTKNGIVPLIMLFSAFVGYLYLYYQAMRPIH